MVVIRTLAKEKSIVDQRTHHEIFVYDQHNRTKSFLNSQIKLVYHKRTC